MAKTDKSKEQHAKDVEDFEDLHPSGCLNRHVDGSPEDCSGDTCSHRWQAYKQMEGASGLYNWDKYESLSKQKSPIKTAAFMKAGSVYPSFYSLYIDQPGEGDWDVGKEYKGQKNFWWKCYHPYWHEAHHLIPNSTLRNAIVKCAKDAPKGDELVVTIRGGLMKEKYKLNAKLNMIMLPLDKAVSKALGLPRHRKTADLPHHGTYSKHVQGRLSEILSALAQRLVNHEAAKYKGVRDQLEQLSEDLYVSVRDSEATSLDHMKKSEYPAAPAPL